MLPKTAVRLIAACLSAAILVRADYTDTAADAVSCTSEDVGSYDLGLHVASVFVLLVASAIGVFVPVVFGDQPTDSLVGRVSFVLKHFGTGIIISLAFCHLLQDSFETFANECIGELSYEPTAAAIAMASAAVMWLIDFFGARNLARVDQCPSDCAPPVLAASGPDSEADTPKTAFADASGCCDAGCRPVEVLDGASKRAHWDVQLLEGGIIFHSIMIGVALGAQTDGFVPTFAALTFHQLFEGLGLGARIGQLKWPHGMSSSVKKWGMCAAYSLITPVGIAIGIGVHHSFNENGRAELLAIGVLNAISAGILLYSGLCQLLFAEWVTGTMRLASKWQVVAGLSALGLGMFAMSLIGKWT